MDWLVALVLLAVAYFFADSGALFAAFLCVVALFLYLAAQKQSAPVSGQVVGRTEDGRPIIVKSTAAKIPKTIKVRVKPAWGDTKSYEDMTETLSTTATIIGRTLYRLFKGAD